MKTTLIKIKNLFGISEEELSGDSVEITGTNGTGKTSVLDAIRYALTNGSERDYIIKEGADSGEIYIETDTGLKINRAKRTQKADYKSVKENGKEVRGAESFLRTLFTPLQLDPVAFTRMSKAEQNRAILDLIDFEWDLGWIKEQFGEIPGGIDYSQNILQVLNDIQAENGEYFQRRQDINREMRTKRNMAAEIAQDIPKGYNAEKWEDYPISEKYKDLEKIRSKNATIDRARNFRDMYDNKLRGLDAEYEIDKSKQTEAIAGEKEMLTSSIARLEAELSASREKLATLDERLGEKLELARARYEEKKAKLNADTEVASEYAGMEKEDASPLQSEIDEAESMRRHLNEYYRMRTMQIDIDSLKEKSDELTRKIELARSLPGEILKNATIPIKGFTVENGVPLINGLPVNNLSEGEQLGLCVDIAMANPSAIQLILIDGAEKLSDANRTQLYDRCKKNGLQFIATRTTNENEMKVTVL